MTKTPEQCLDIIYKFVYHILQEKEVQNVNKAFVYIKSFTTSSAFKKNIAVHITSY